MKPVRNDNGGHLAPRVNSRHAWLIERDRVVHENPSVLEPHQGHHSLVHRAHDALNAPKIRREDFDGRVGEDGPSLVSNGHDAVRLRQIENLGWQSA